MFINEVYIKIQLIFYLKLTKFFKLFLKITYFRRLVLTTLN